MQFLERFSRGKFSLTRTEAFSDAIFAIIAFAVCVPVPLSYITPWNERVAARIKSKPRR
jgi:hypothetical protein